MVKIYAELFASFQDQPERRATNHLMLGNGQYTSRFRYAADLSAVSNVIPACDKCLEEELLNPDLYLKNICENCLAWDMPFDSGRLDFPPPKNYPQEMIPKSGRLRPFVIIYESLTQAVALAHDKLVKEKWSYKNCESFLRVNGICKNTIEQVLEKWALRSYV